MDSKRLALLSVLAALCIGIQLLPVRGQLLPNIEFTSLIAFVTGVVLGSFFGGLLGAVVMFVNGFLSPVGLAGINMPFQMAGIALIGIAGGIYARMVRGSFSSRAFVELAILGAFLTFVYDVVTNVGMAVGFALNGMAFPQAVVVSLIGGVLFSVIHISWNAALFGTTTVPIVNAIQRILGWR